MLHPKSVDNGKHRQAAGINVSVSDAYIGHYRRRMLQVPYGMSEMKKCRRVEEKKNFKNAGRKHTTRRNVEEVCYSSRVDEEEL